MKERALNFGKQLKATYKAFGEHDTFMMGAALSYYTIFSLAPVLIIVIAVAGFFFGEEAVRGEIFHQVEDMMGAKSALQIQEMIKASYKPGQSTLATIIAVGLLLFGATSVFNQLQASLNVIWEVKPKPQKGYVKYIRDRLLSFSIILGVGFLLLVSLVVNAAMVALTGYLKQNLPDISVLLFRALDIALTLGITTLLFALIYKYLPDAKIKWRHVWAGALFTAILFAAGRFLIGLYLGHSDVGSAYGAAGSIIVVLVWVNYSSQILFFGAEFTQVFVQSKGEIIRPSEVAVRVKTIDVPQGDSESDDQFEQKVKRVDEAKNGDSFFV